jgi:hypothetical protein
MFDLSLLLLLVFPSLVPCKLLATLSLIKRKSYRSDWQITDMWLCCVMPEIVSLRGLCQNPGHKSSIL